MSRSYDSRIGRQRHALQIQGTPIVSVMLGSMTPAILPVVAQSPFLPPFGLMVFIAWRLLRPEIWPLWIALPLGLFDDVMSGQPIGSAVFLWTIVLLALEFEGHRSFWRNHWHDWLAASVAIVFALLGGWVCVHLAGKGGSVVQIFPQIAYSIGLFPLVVRICAALDRWRLP